jgi:hypothetical protein
MVGEISLKSDDLKFKPTKLDDMEVYWGMNMNDPPVIQQSTVCYGKSPCLIIKSLS